MLPHAALFARLTTLAEWAVAISLILGLFTQAGAMVGIWLNLNYTLMKGLQSSGGSVDRLFVLSELVFLVTAAGLVWGFDGLLWPWIARTVSGRSPTTSQQRHSTPARG